MRYLQNLKYTKQLFKDMFGHGLCHLECNESLNLSW